MKAEDLLAEGRSRIQDCRQEGFSSYLKRDLPTALDGKIVALLDLFREAGAEQRELLRAQISGHLWGALPVFAERMAMLSVRQRDRKVLLDGFAALALESGRSDPRETLSVMSLLHRSAELLDLDPQPLFDGTAHFATESFAPAFPAFVRRDPAMKRIETMGYEELRTSEGDFLGYRRRW